VKAESPTDLSFHRTVHEKSIHESTRVEKISRKRIQAISIPVFVFREQPKKTPSQTSLIAFVTG
jgi:hypothetical protein